MAAEEFVRRLEEVGVRLLSLGETVRAVTHRDVSQGQIGIAIERMRELLAG